MQLNLKKKVVRFSCGLENVFWAVKMRFVTRRQLYGMEQEKSERKKCAPDLTETLSSCVISVRHLVSARGVKAIVPGSPSGVTTNTVTGAGAALDSNLLSFSGWLFDIFFFNSWWVAAIVSADASWFVTDGALLGLHRLLKENRLRIDWGVMPLKADVNRSVALSPSHDEVVLWRNRKSAPADASTAEGSEVSSPHPTTVVANRERIFTQTRYQSRNKQTNTQQTKCKRIVKQGQNKYSCSSFVFTFLFIW